MFFIEFMIWIALMIGPTLFIGSYLGKTENKLLSVLILCLVCGWLLLSFMAGFKTMWDGEHNGIFEYFIYFFSNMAYFWNIE